MFSILLLYVLYSPFFNGNKITYSDYIVLLTIYKEEEHIRVLDKEEVWDNKQIWDKEEVLDNKEYEITKKYVLYCV